jgi:hypothetical protein
MVILVILYIPYYGSLMHCNYSRILKEYEFYLLKESHRYYFGQSILHLVYVNIGNKIIEKGIFLPICRGLEDILKEVMDNLTETG